MRLVLFGIGLLFLLTGWVYLAAPDPLVLAPPTTTSPPSESAIEVTDSSTTTSTIEESPSTTLDSPPAIPSATAPSSRSSTSTSGSESSGAIARSTTSVAPYASLQAADGEPDDFWWQLAACESENGRTSDNQFQFMGGTEDEVGYYDGASYEEQKAMAEDWASRLRAEGTHPGSTAGWPVCWWEAGGG